MKLSALFSDGAVFQRRKPITVFGRTDPGSIVSCTFAEKSATGLAGLDGSFELRLGSCEAGGPYELEVTNRKTGVSVHVNDILVGEVWVASGQSNMEYSMTDVFAERHDGPPDIELLRKTGRTSLAEFLSDNCASHEIRMFNVVKNASGAREGDLLGQWKCATFENVAGFSAVGFWFAKKLHDELQVPVGILHASWGGTFIEAWTSRNTLRSTCAAEMLAEYEAVLPRASRWENVNPDPCAIAESQRQDFLETCEKICVKDTENLGFARGWAKEEVAPDPWCDYKIPGFWTMDAIAGNGVVWIRKTFEIPEGWAGKDAVLHLGGIDKHDTTYFNGEEVGRTGKGFEPEHWDSPRTYPIPGYLMKAGKNVVAIRAWSFIYAGGFCGPEESWYLESSVSGETYSLAGAVKLAVEVDHGMACNPERRTIRAMGPKIANSPGILFDGMIRPLIPYTIQGAIWYQGESNAGWRDEAENYDSQIRAMIADWRFWWGQGDFPFYQVQLANFSGQSAYREEDNWPILREAQRKSSCEIPNGGFAVTIDVGDAQDIHPKDKRSVGMRLAAQALSKTYHLSNVVPGGPLVREARREGNAIRVFFEDCADGLRFRGGDARGFYLAGSQAVFCEATAVIDGNSVLLTSPDVEVPLRVRYAWANNPKYAGLENSAGYPASPFECTSAR